MGDSSSFDTVEILRPEPSARGPALVRAEFGAMTHVGKVREGNEDNFLVAKMGRLFEPLITSLPASELGNPAPEVGYVLVVADGMGGMAAGERASLTAIRTGVRLVMESPRWALTIDDAEIGPLIDRMKNYFREVDDAVIREAQLDPRLKGMGTTLTVAYTAGDHAFFVHAGDSRAYLHRRGELRLLTRDHSLPGRRNVLLNFAGVRGIDPEITTLRLLDGDRLLLCTDGLTNMVPDPRIGEILDRVREPQPAAAALIEAALDAGGRDNVTAIVASYAIA